MSLRSFLVPTLRDLTSQAVLLANERNLVIDGAAIAILLSIFVCLYAQVLDIHV